MSRQGFAPLRQRSFRLLVGGQLASNVGDAFYAVALPWYVLEQHEGAMRLGELLAIYGVARTATMVAGGHASDRFRPWTAMMAADLVRAAALSLFTVVVALGPARLWMIAPVALIAGAGEGIFLPASFAIVPELLDDADLQAGNALSSGGTQLAMLAGPALGGLVVATAGPALAFAVDTLSFVASAVSLMAIGRGGRPVHRATALTTESEGSRSPTFLEVIRSERIIPLILLIDVVANLGSGGAGEVAIPALAHGPFHAGATGYGALIGALAAGALLGTLIAAQVRTPARPALIASFGFIVSAAFMAAVPYLGGAPGAAGALFCAGLMMSFSNVLTSTAFQRWAPRRLLGRLTGVTLLGSYGIFPVSVLLGGIVVGQLGPAVFLPMASAMLAAALLFALSHREWREFGAERPQRTVTVRNL